MASEARTKKIQTVGPTDEIEIEVPPCMTTRRISVMAKKLQNQHVRVAIAAGRDILIADAQTASLDTISVLSR